LSVSDDSGQSWSAPQIISGSDQLVNAAMIATGLNGLVYVVYLNNPLKSKQSATEGDDEPGDKLPPTPTMQDVRVVYSLDYGQHFSEPLTVGQQPEPVQLLSQVELSTLPTIALHPHTNEVYVAYVSQSTGASHAEIMLTHAAHGKSAWSAPRSVFPDAAAKGIYYFQPQLAVNEAGRIALSAFAYEDGKIHVVLARFHSPDLSLQNRLVVTSQPFDPTLASSGGGFSWFIGDYQGLTSGPETFYPFWNDTRTGKLEIFTAAV
ncbi:MAG: exo-alpha-sialidase, partial [Ktedonobacteraceae bacterium]|nr:exo-alpha-sialidase [Ktedonobacteraceae bacterium]